MWIYAILLQKKKYRNFQNKVIDILNSTEARYIGIILRPFHGNIQLVQH